MHTAVIGIGPGLGTALARRFAQEGHHVSAVARSVGSAKALADVLQVSGGRAAGYEGDASDAESMAAIFAQMATDHGPVDNLVFNVAQIKPDRFVTRSGKDQLSYGERWVTRGAAVSVDEFIETLRVNVGSALTCVKLVADAMCKRRSGTILITGGTLGLTPWIEWGSLSAGKAALRSVARSLFKELRPYNVHTALVTIHDTITPGTAYDPDAIASYYWGVVSQASADWVAEYDFNPTHAQAVDRDL